MLRYLALGMLIGLAACDYTNIGGEPCGGERSIDAKAVLPDTGLGAGGGGSVGFMDSGPYRTTDESSLIVWLFPPSGTQFADSPPRIRVLNDDGTVFLDYQAISAYQGSWYVRQSIPSVAAREQLIAAAQAGKLTIELSNADRVTRVRPTVTFAGTRPVMTCL